MRTTPRDVQASSAADFLPERLSLPQLRAAAANCQGCPLYQNATQTVFGEGRKAARLLLIGEQPGDQEDLQGRPFVGPAGNLLHEALEAAQIDEGDVYVTNAVKHFKWEPRGKRRLHAKPNSREIAACRPWLEAEIEVIEPRMIVCLGATAAQTILGKAYRLTKERGEVRSYLNRIPALATFHPSAILRAPDRDARHQMRQFLIEDLATAAKFATDRT
jgi:uracil-DNA glycosylase family protein